MNKPNIFFILVDQMRPDELGISTPNLNAMAQRGVRFENCYSASPLCQPSRNCIVTGRFPTQHGVCGNMNEPISTEERTDTYPQYLRQAGYHTAYIGKHHYYDRYNLGVDLTDDDEAICGYGYDHVWQVGDVIEGRHNDDRYTKWMASHGKLDEYRRNLSSKYYEGLDPAETVDGYICETALEYLRNYDKDQPLLLTVGIVGPHPPYWAPGKYGRMFAPADMRIPKACDGTAVERFKTMRAKKMGMIALIDDYVGKFLGLLEEKGMTENTLVIFTADHGDNIGDYGVTDKRFYFEQSVKVPLILTGHGVLVDRRAPANVCKAFVSGIDLYPTLLDAAGCGNIRGNSHRQGLSILRILNRTQPRRNAIFSELGTAMMVRDANWKLVYDAEQDGVQYLFNLRRDPGEINNLAGVPEYREIEAVLLEKLLSQMICLTRHTHTKEENNVQRVRV